MFKLSNPAYRLVIVFALALILSLSLGCGSKEDADTQTTGEMQTTHGQTVQKARDVVAALSNPKVGVDPVCNMAIDEDAVIVTIDGKDYGFCSKKCAEAAEADPEKYLMAEADPHEGHNH
jgi:YHS domain-containing protein